MLNYNTSIKEEKSYSDLEMKEIKPIMKLIIRGKTKDFITAIGKNLNMILPTEANTSTTGEVLEEGAQIVANTNITPVEMLGHVTSSYYSPNLNKSIALAVVRNGKNMMGQKLFIPMENKNISVTIVDPVFFDKENVRLNA